MTEEEFDRLAGDARTPLPTLRLARELALMHVEGYGPASVSSYNWKTADRIWRRSFILKAERLIRAMEAPT